MRGTDTLENVIGKVHEISANHYDEVVPVRDMSFESLVQIEHRRSIVRRAHQCSTASG